jgi:hypothetical protein
VAFIELAGNKQDKCYRIKERAASKVSDERIHNIINIS